jgi:hypothetical protein
MMLLNEIAARHPTLVGNLTHAALYVDADPAIAGAQPDLRHD